MLGLMVLIWFGSGFVMAYYRWPALTESQQARILRPFTPGPGLIGFAAARDAAAPRGETSTADISGASLRSWNGRPTYALHGVSAAGVPTTTLVDGYTGAIVSPIAPGAAVLTAREFTGEAGPEPQVTLLGRGDLYMMNVDYAADFPAYRVRFHDPAGTAVYVNSGSGLPVGIVTRATRLTTWFGTVPHWLYIRPLYDSRPTWRFVNIVLPTIAALLALTGIILGVSQLLPHRARGSRQVSPYRGVSRWHHLAGIGFGVLVLMWATSGAFQMVGSSTAPPLAFAGRVRGPLVDWRSLRVTESQAVRRGVEGSPAPGRPLRIDLVELAGRLGYDVRLEDGREFWVDGTSGAVRSELSQADVRSAASRVLAAPIAQVDRLAAYDRYYYARPGRELHLPVWRVRFGDAQHTALYLNTVTGEPLGFVDPTVRRWRWLRDGLHSFDYPALNNRRPLWDAVVLPLLAGGFLSALTGVWLAVRRARRLARQKATSRE